MGYDGERHGRHLARGLRAALLEAAISEGLSTTEYGGGKRTHFVDRSAVEAGLNAFLAGYPIGSDAEAREGFARDISNIFSLDYPSLIKMHLAMYEAKDQANEEPQFNLVAYAIESRLGGKVLDEPDDNPRVWRLMALACFTQKQAYKLIEEGLQGLQG